MWHEAGRLRDYLGEIPLEVQLLKLSEEVGEVADAFIGMHGLNPRKGVCRTREDLLGELSDVIIITAAVAMCRAIGDPQDARAAFEAHLSSVIARADL